MNATSLRQRARAGPYIVSRPAVISFGGGRTSGYMLKHILDAFGGRLPDDISVVFANTAMERPETLEFIDICARAWSIDIVWAELDWAAPHRTRIVDYTTASRNGEPYAARIERKGFLPNQKMRFCSSFMKRDRIDTIARYWLGLKRWHSGIGLRADERRRVIWMRTLNCGSRTGAHASLPLADAGVREADVMAWWKEQPFDLGIPRLRRKLFALHVLLKSRGKLLRLIREDPALADCGLLRSVPSPTAPAQTAAPARA